MLKWTTQAPHLSSLMKPLNTPSDGSKNNHIRHIYPPPLIHLPVLMTVMGIAHPPPFLPISPLSDTFIKKSLLLWGSWLSCYPTLWSTGLFSLIHCQNLSLAITMMVTPQLLRSWSQLQMFFPSIHFSRLLPPLPSPSSPGIASSPKSWTSTF